MLLNYNKLSNISLHNELNTVFKANNQVILIEKTPLFDSDKIKQMSENDHLTSLKQRLFPDLIKLADRAKSLKCLHPVTQVSESSSYSFHSRLFNPQKQYHHSTPLTPHTKQGSTPSRLHFVKSSFSFVSKYIQTHFQDSTLLSHLQNLQSSVLAVLEQAFKTIKSKQKMIEQEHLAREKVITINSILSKQNQELMSENRKLLKYERGVNQIKLTYENDKLMLEIEELTRVLSDKQNKIIQLEEIIQQLAEQNSALKAEKEKFDVKTAKLKEQMEMLEITKDFNLKTKMMYILGWS